MKRLIFCILALTLTMALSFGLCSCGIVGNPDDSNQGGNITDTPGNGDNTPDNPDDGEDPGNDGIVDDSGNDGTVDDGNGSNDNKPDDPGIELPPNDEHTHNFVIENTSVEYLKSAATCTIPGIYYYSCECGECGYGTFTYGNPLGHTWIEATCTSAASCSYCGATSGLPLEHNFSDGYCTGCGIPEDGSDIVPPDGCKEHHYEIVESAPDCTQDGYVVRYCTVCYYEELLELFPAIGHSFVGGRCEICGEPEGSNPGIEDIPDPDKCQHSYQYMGTPATCIEDGMMWGICILCGDETEEIQKATGHTFGADDICTTCGFSLADHECLRTRTEKVNEKDATCTTAGGYDNVTYCIDCRKEISRTNVKTSDPLGHTGGSSVKENEIAATCSKGGSYDEVIYCSVCDEEISRETKEIAALPHTDGDSVKENVTEATCAKSGSYDKVVYCSVCKSEVSRETITVSVPHTPMDSVKENETDATCSKDGGYDVVIYCSVCKNEISRVTTVIAALPHTPKDSVIENATEATCTDNGEYDEVIYCSVCSTEISRKTTVVEKLGHTYVTGACSVCGKIKPSENLSFRLNDDGTYYLDGIGSCSDTKIIIPDEYNGRPVTAIGTYAFKDCTKVTGIMIPKTVTKIRSYAFSGCTNLKNIYIEDLAAWCSIDFSSQPFQYATNLYINNKLVTEIVIPSSVTCIKRSAFSGCKSLTSVIIPDSITTIEAYAFKGCSGLKDIIVPNSVTTIEVGAFKDCSGLKSITLPFIGTSLHETKETHFGSIFGAESYSENKASVPASLSTVTVTGGDKIDSYAFRGCSSIGKISVSESIASIGKYAFAGCSLNTLKIIGNALTNIDTYAFSDCSISAVDVSDIFYWCENYCKYLNQASSLLLNGEVVVDLVIPEGVTQISDNAFSNFTKIKTVSIPYGVTTIGNYAFQGCSSLTSIFIPYSVTSIGDYAFAFCAIQSVTLSEGVTSIGNDAFRNCPGLVLLTIPETVTTIGDRAFYDCHNLVSVTLGKNLSNVGYAAFARSTGTGKIVEIINKSSLDITLGSSDFGLIARYAKEIHSGESKIALDENYIFYTFDGVNYLLGYIGEDTELVLPINYYGKSYEIYDNAFIYSGITEVAVSEATTSIGSHAFAYCNNLTSVTIPDTVTSIYTNAFYQCSNIKSVHVDSISSWCNVLLGNEWSSPLYNTKEFYVNGHLTTDIVIPNDITSIYAYTFRGYIGLVSITIPNNVTTIEYGAFLNCSSMEEISIPFAGMEKDGSENTHFGYIFGAYTYSQNAEYVPKSLKTVEITGSTYIDNNAFYDCSGLTNIIVGDKVTSIYRGAFQGCTGLVSITVPFVGMSKDSTEGPESHFGYIFGYALPITEGSGYHYFSNGYYYTFYIPTSLETVTIGNGTNKIEGLAFHGCYEFTKVVIPETITVISGMPFSNCPNITIYCEADSKPAYWSASWNYYGNDVVWGYVKE